MIDFKHAMCAFKKYIQDFDSQYGKIDIEKTIKREVLEELKIDLNDTDNVLFNKMSYIYVSEKDEQPGVQLFSKTKTKMSVDEIKNHFERYYSYLKENNLEIEFKKLHFLNKTNAIRELEKLNNPKRNYLMPLLQMDMKGI